MFEKIQWRVWDIICWFVRKRERQKRLWYFLNRHIRFTPTFTIGVVIVALCKQGVLLVRKKRGPRGSEWVLPGGGVKRGETLEQAAVRELEEEAGFKISPSGLTQIGCCLDSIFWDQTVGFMYEHKGQRCLPPAGIRDTTEIAERKFFYPHQALSLVYKAHRQFIFMAMEKNRSKSTPKV